jgi:hypothetical protein
MNSLNPFPNEHEYLAFLHGTIAAYASRVSELEKETRKLRNELLQERLKAAANKRDEQEDLFHE